MAQALLLDLVSAGAHLETVPAPLWVFDHTGCRFANSAWHELTGRATPELAVVHEEDRDARLAALQSGAPVAWRLVRPDGSLKWVREHAAPLAHGTIAYLEDVTAQRRTAARLERAEAALQRADDDRALFVRGASHELRAPMSAVLLQLGLALRTDLPEAGREHVQRALRNVERMQNLVADLLDASARRPAALELRNVDLGGLLEDAVASMQAPADVKRVHVATHGPPLRVEADPPRLLQVAVNLLSNAIRFTPRGGEVRVSWAREDAHAVFRVEDEGPGVAQERRAELFQPFSRLGRPQVDAGTGLGLYISRTIVDAHGGTIALEDAAKGACFRVALPL